jgi:glutathione S-transferase
MPLTLYYHPLSSYCQKVLIALYENQTPFEKHFLNLMDAGERAHFRSLWPVGKMPLLVDSARNQTLPETSIIIEYLEQHYPGAHPLLPRGEESRMEARLWDRICDLYIHNPMQKAVTDAFRPKGANDPHGVADAEATIRTVYGMLESRLAHRIWLVEDTFSMADCAATPALFYASVAVPFGADQKHLAAYFERLVARPAAARTIDEAKPFFHMFPLNAKMQARFR